MKRRLRHRVRVIGILFAFTVAIGPTTFPMASGKNEARVTQAIHDVQLLAPNAAPRPASINGNVRPGIAVRTGTDSRAELSFTDRTLARVGANSVLSFGEGGFDFANGSILLYPAEKFRGRQNQHRGCDSSRYQFHSDGRVSSQVMDQIHHPRRSRQHLSQTSSRRG